MRSQERSLSQVQAAALTKRPLSQSWISYLFALSVKSVYVNVHDASFGIDRILAAHAPAAVFTELQVARPRLDSPAPVAHESSRLRHRAHLRTLM